MNKIPREITQPVPSVDTLCEILHINAGLIKSIDGDRDYMNPSNLTVQQTMATADYINMAIARLRELQSRIETY